MPHFLLVQPPGDSVTAAVAAWVAGTVLFWFKVWILIYMVFLADTVNLDCSNGGVC